MGGGPNESHNFLPSSFYLKTSLDMVAFCRYLAVVSAALLARADGFSPVSTIGSAPLAAPQSNLSRRRQQQQQPQPIPGSRDLKGLYMSDVAFNDQSVASGHCTDSTVAVVVEEIATLGNELDNQNERSGQVLSTGISRRIGEINFNEVFNTGIVVLLAIAILYKLTMVNAGMTRGWSMEEIATQTVAMNWSGYMNILHESPVATKAVTSATVYTIGDLIAQRTDGTSMGDLDRSRITRSMLVGLIGHGPMSHVWYQVSESFFNSVHLTQWWSFIPKVAVDQTVFGPIWNNSYILLIGLMKLESIDKIWSDMKRTTIPLIVSGLKLWPLAHCVTYGLIPVENRLLWVDMVEIVWVTILATQAAALVDDNVKASTEEATEMR